jgi:hypothetical protein
MTKHKLIKILLQMFESNPPLMGPKQPSLKQGDNSIYMRQRSLGGTLCSYDHMLEPFFSEGIVSSPPICFHDSALLNMIYNKGDQTQCRKIKDMPNTNSSKPTSVFFDFHCHDDTGFLKALSTPNSRFLTSNKCIVNLYSPRQLLPASPDHCPSKFVKPSPGGLRAFQTKDSLQTSCADPCLLSANPPHGTKPHQQRLPGALHDCSGDQGSLMVTVGTFNKVALVGPSMAVPTLWATKTVWPSLRENILPARLFAIESLAKLHQISWKIWLAFFSHAPILENGVT